MWWNEEKELYLPRNWISSLEDYLKLNSIQLERETKKTTKPIMMEK